jgi:apolipoprotein N-acyltransferase
LAEIGQEAKRIGAPLAVGITEDAPGDHFLNAQVLVDTDGQIIGRYDKVHRVPFGEYMPLRGLLHALGAPTDLVPRDAVAGTRSRVPRHPRRGMHGPRRTRDLVGGVLRHRAAEGVRAGGTVIVNPTNGSSYTGTILQSQQVASSRLRAIENGRWVVQVSPTGFSAFVSADGDVFDRTGVSEQKVVTRTVPLLLRPHVVLVRGRHPVPAVDRSRVRISWIVPGRVALERRRLTPPTAV